MGQALNRKTAFLILMILPIVSLAVFSQEIISAEKFFAGVSASFGAVKDYEATVTITQGKTGPWKGKLYFKSPLYLRINFDDPRGQVFLITDETLTIYVPQLEAILVQKYQKKGSAAIAAMVSSQGLSMLQQNYSVAFLSTPNPVPLDEGSKEMVTKLKLTSRGVSGFRQLVLSISKDNFIRRMEGVQTNGESVTLDLANVKVNQGIPDSRFVYDTPPYANVYNDFLFDSRE
jgi:outer membrane lipoprotein-sorting protein